MDITTRLRPHAGPCAAPLDVDRLLNSYTSAKERMLANTITAEILFQKLVLLKSSPYPKVRGTMPQLVQRLKQFFGVDEVTENAELPPLSVHQQQPAAKQWRLQPDTDSVSDDSEASDPETEFLKFKLNRVSFQQQEAGGSHHVYGKGYVPDSWAASIQMAQEKGRVCYCSRICVC